MENQDPESLWPASSACTVANNKETLTQLEVEGKDCHLSVYDHI